MLRMNLGAHKLVNEPPGRQGKFILEHLPPPLLVLEEADEAPRKTLWYFILMMMIAVTKLLSYSALASFKIKFTHNCCCYNGNLLHLKCLLSRTTLLMRMRWEFGCTDRVDLDLKKMEGEIHAYTTEASNSQINPSQGECGLKSLSTLLLWGFSTADQVYAALAREKGKL